MPDDRPNNIRAGMSRMRQRTGVRMGVLLIVLALGLCAPGGAMAQEPVTQPYGGDLWSRPRLTGDWFGVRDEMAKRGVTIDLDLLQILQGVGSGGRETDVGSWGLVDYRLNLDTGKLGLWPGGLFDTHAMSSYGTSVNNQAGPSFR